MSVISRTSACAESRCGTRGFMSKETDAMRCAQRKGKRKEEQMSKKAGYEKSRGAEERRSEETDLMRCAQRGR